MRRLVGTVLLALSVTLVDALSHTQLNMLQSQLKDRSRRQLFGSRPKKNQNIFPGKTGPSIIYQGLYIPDPRFNSFADGIITNMVSDMRASSLDPVYFRLNNRGRVTAHNSRGRDNSASVYGLSALLTPSARMLSNSDVTRVADLERNSSDLRQRMVRAFGADEENRKDDQRQEDMREKRQLVPSRKYSTGLLEGLTNINRRGDVEVQVASNVTLVRGRWLLGPLIYRVNYYENQYATRSLATEIPPIQMDTVTQISYIGADMADFVLGCPLMSALRFLGNVTSKDQDVANKAIHNLFQFNSFLYETVTATFKSASYARLPLYSSTRTNDPHKAPVTPGRTDSLLLLGRRRRQADATTTKLKMPDGGDTVRTKSKLSAAIPPGEQA